MMKKKIRLNGTRYLTAVYTLDNGLNLLDLLDMCTYGLYLTRRRLLSVSYSGHSCILMSPAALLSSLFVFRRSILFAFLAGTTNCSFFIHT